MAHFAEIDGNGTVLRVIVAEQDFIDSIGGQWIQTSYNTFSGVHKSGGEPLRKNYAGAGYKYDSLLDAFIPPKTFSSWLLDEATCLWHAPKEMPLGGDYVWDEDVLDWVNP